MAPPHSVLRTSSQPRFFPSSQAELKEMLRAKNFFVDPSHNSDPYHLYKKWDDFLQDQSKYHSLGNVIRALQFFMHGDTQNMSAYRLKQVLTQWVKEPTFSTDPVHQNAFKNIQRILGQFKNGGHANNKAQAEKVFELRVLPENSVGKRDKIVDGKNPGKKQEQSGEKPQGFKVNAVSFRTHFLDDKFRKAPSYYSAKVLPSEGFGQNQSSKGAVSAGLEFGYKNFLGFLEFYYNDAMPLSVLLSGSPNLDNNRYSAKFEQGGIRFGLIEQDDQLFLGRRFHGWNIGLLGKKRIGIGFGASKCTEVNGQSNSPLCTKRNFQFSIINESDFLTMGYGPLELSIGLIPLTVYINQNDKNGLPDSNRLPMDFSFSYYFNKPYLASKKPQTIEELLGGNEKVTNPQVTFSLFNILTNSVRINWILRNEIGAQSLRFKALQGDVGGDLHPDQVFTLGNALSMVNGVIGGGLSGAMAYRLQRELRFGSNAQRGVLGAALAAEFLANAIGFGATPGIPSQQEFSEGKTEGISNIQARVYRLTVPLLGIRNVLTGLGALNAFGDLNAAIKGDGKSSYHFLIAHGAILGMGLAMALTSGDQSGSSFLGGTIAGDKYPNPVPSSIDGTQYDYGSQNGRLLRLFTGSMFVGYGFSALTKFIFGRYQYNKLLGKSASGGSNSSSSKQGASLNNLQLRLNTDGKTFGNLTVEGRF